MNKLKTIYIVFKTHFDIGFTGLASEVINSYQGDMLERLIEICEATASDPEEYRYVWTMSAWPLKKLLETQDKSMQEQAVKLVEEGRLAWHALPFTVHTDFCGVEEFVRGFGISAGLDKLFHKKHIAAKMTDVPGHTRMLPSLLSKAGVKFLHLGCNACVMPPEVPRCFYWKGTDGEGVVTFYKKGGYGTDLLPPDDWEYPVWLALMNTSDNEGPHSVEMIREIIENIKEELPETRVVIGSLDDFAHAFLSCNPELPVIDTDLADSWIHGVGTYPIEVSRVRCLRKTLMNVEGAISLKKAIEGFAPGNNKAADNNRKAIDTAYENILLFDEHTWGLDTKLALMPLHNGCRVYDKKLFLEDKGKGIYERLETSWKEKAGYVKRAEDAVEGIVRSFQKGSGKQISVYNLLSWARDGEVDVTGFAQPGDALVDNSGCYYHVYEMNGRCAVQLKNVPPIGCMAYSLEKKGLSSRYCQIAADDGNGGAVLENSGIIIAIDGQTGNITRFYDKTNGREWVGRDGKFGGYTYDIHGKDRIIQYLKDYAFDFEDWYLADNGRPCYPGISDKTYTAQSCKVEVENLNGRGIARVAWQMPAESVEEYGNAREVIMTVTLKQESHYMDIAFDLKGKVETPFVESANFVFSLNAAAPEYAVQKMGAVVDPMTDIQYGANTSLYCCDRWMSVSDGEHGLAFLPKDTPLLSIGENRIYVYSKDYKPQKPVLYWNAFNNQWGTNFPQWVGGDFRYEFRVCPYSGTWSSAGIPELAEEYATPLLPLNYGGQYSLLYKDIRNATVLCFKNADNNEGSILRLQENRGETGELKIRLGRDRGVYARCSLLEEDIELFPGAAGEVAVKTEPFEVHTFRIIDRSDGK